MTEKPDGSQGFTDNTTWNDLYARINYTNVILDELDEITPDNERDELKKNRIMGETYFLRAQFSLFWPICMLLPMLLRQLRLLWQFL